MEIFDFQAFQAFQAIKRLTFIAKLILNAVSSGLVYLKLPQIIYTPPILEIKKIIPIRHVYTIIYSISLLTLKRSLEKNVFTTKLD